MARFNNDEDLRSQRRSFMSSSGCSFSNSDDDDDLMFEQVSKYASIQPAWFESSCASRRRNLEHKLCETNSTIAELHRVGVRDGRISAPSALLEDRAKLSPATCRIPAPTRGRPHRAHRCIAESLATIPTIVDAYG